MFLKSAYTFKGRQKRNYNRDFVPVNTVFFSKLAVAGGIPRLAGD
jgi:hypothetical protein